MPMGPTMPTGPTMPIRPGMRGGGAVPERIFTELVLVDPMTQEEISRTYDIILQDDIRRNPELTDRDLGRVKLTPLGTEQYIERDHWFRIQLKFIWKDAPTPVATDDGMMGRSTF